MRSNQSFVLRGFVVFYAALFLLSSWIFELVNSGLRQNVRITLIRCHYPYNLLLWIWPFDWQYFVSNLSVCAHDIVFTTYSIRNLFETCMWTILNDTDISHGIVRLPLFFLKKGGKMLQNGMLHFAFRLSQLLRITLES